MALTQVRVKLGDTWTVLTYNSATGRYEGTITPPGTSIHQPGGYYVLTAQATNASGDTAEISGTQLPSLRLVVRETTAPTLTLVSPSPGYLTTTAPTFIFDATDEAGGSGVNPATFSLAGATSTPITGGYRFTWTPPGGWAEGSHTITASVSDYDGNESTVSGAYIVDTVPPELRVLQPLRHVVDDESITVAGEAWDNGSGIASVTIGGAPASPLVGEVAQRAGGGESGGELAPLSLAALDSSPTEGGAGFTAQVPLAVGINNITVAATDGAGNQTTAQVYVIRLITDRTQADVAALVDLYDRGMANWTEAELAWFNSGVVRGAYNDDDLNRVGAAVAWLAAELERRGFLAPVQPKTDWTEADAPTRGQMQTYLANVEAVRIAQGLPMPPIPATMRHSNIDGWNKIEKALVETDAVLPYYTAWTAGEVTCGGA